MLNTWSHNHWTTKALKYMSSIPQNTPCVQWALSVDFAVQRVQYSVKTLPSCWPTLGLDCIHVGHEWTKTPTAQVLCNLSKCCLLGYKEGCYQCITTHTPVHHTCTISGELFELFNHWFGKFDLSTKNCECRNFVVKFSVFNFLCYDKWQKFEQQNFLYLWSCTQQLTHVHKQPVTRFTYL